MSEIRKALDLLKFYVISNKKSCATDNGISMQYHFDVN